MGRAWLKNNWRRSLAVLICLVFLLDKQVWHKIQFDAVTISLIVIIVILFVFPNPQVVFPYIKRIKLWEAEIELKEEIKELGKEVEKVQQAANSASFSEPEKSPSPNEVNPNSLSAPTFNLENVLIAAGKDPRAALLLLATKIEYEVKKRLHEAGLSTNKQYLSLSEAVKLGTEKGIFPPEILPAFRDFWAIRNKVAHAEGFDVSDNTIYSIISVGTELLKVISTEKSS